MLTYLIALLLAAILIMTIVTFTSTSTVANAQQGQIQVESEGDLEATLNGDSFTTGDTITISGTVVDRAVGSFVNIDVIDPESATIVQASPPITADDTFTYSFEAGAEEGTDILEPMERSGNYRVVVSYYENSGDFDIDEVELEFSYSVTSTSSPTAPSESGEVAEEQSTRGAGGGSNRNNTRTGSGINIATINNNISKQRQRHSCRSP